MSSSSGISGPGEVPLRTVGEWAIRSSTPYASPFADVTVVAQLSSPSGQELRMPAFHDGDGTWRIRFNPGEVGLWKLRTTSTPTDPELETEGEFSVTPRAARGFLRSTPGEAWGFTFESREPVFIFGDTTYNLFGMAHCGIDVESFMRRRVAQGFNLLRVRVPVSPFHPPEGYSDWQTRRTWPWGGSEQAPRFDQFNLDYFRTVDRVVQLAEDLELGLELIMEAWGFEFPFNSRQIFTAEWEELWLRYLVARYDAYTSTWLWTPLNEYEYYPNGDWHYTTNADRWLLRISRWIKENAPHGHVVAAHNGPGVPPFAQRFASDPAAVDAVLFQEWGTTGETNAWLAAGIEESIDRSLAGWGGSAVLAEWGYERNPEFDLRMPGHAYCDVDHTRRGAWRGVFRAMGIIHGFENSWGPWERLDEDQPGLAHLQHIWRFVTELVPFHEVNSAPELLGEIEAEVGHRPQALANEDRTIVAVYLPTGKRVSLWLDDSVQHEFQWFDPRSGRLQPAVAQHEGRLVAFDPPSVGDPSRPWDWVLVARP